MSGTKMRKDPDAVLDYSHDFSLWLAASGEDTIIASEWIVPDGITEVEGYSTFTDTTTTIWLSGGTAGQKYSLVNRITTDGDRVYDYTMVVVVKEL